MCLDMPLVKFLLKGIEKCLKFWFLENNMTHSIIYFRQGAAPNWSNISKNIFYFQDKNFSNVFYALILMDTIIFTQNILYFG